MTNGTTTREVLDGIAVGGVPPLPARPKMGSVITVTEWDGSRVTATTWNACLGVSTLVRSFMGEPTARAVIDIEEL